MMRLNNASAAFEQRKRQPSQTPQTPGPSDQGGGRLRARHPHHGRTFWLTTITLADRHPERGPTDGLLPSATALCPCGGGARLRYRNLHQATRAMRMAAASLASFLPPLPCRR